MLTAKTHPGHTKKQLKNRCNNRKLRTTKVRSQKSGAGKSPKQKGFSSSFATKEAFKDAVSKSKEYIAAGDIFQVVLSQRFERRSNIEPFDIYRALRVVNPSPYMYFINTEMQRL